MRDQVLHTVKQGYRRLQPVVGRVEARRTPDGRLTVGTRAIQGIRTYGPSLAARWVTPERRFVIFVSTGRMGSELLVSLLSSHPDIWCDSEILSERRTLPHRVVAGREVLASLSGAKAYGFKLLSNHFRWDQQPRIGPAEDYIRRLHNSGYRVIVLERRDLLQHAISILKAEESTGYDHPREGGQHAFTPLVVDPLHVIAVMRIVEEGIEYSARAVQGVTHMRLVYEDDLLDATSQQRTVARVCSYLELPPAPVASDLVRITPRRTTDMVANYDEVAEVLRGTRYEKYIGPAAIGGSEEAVE